MAISGWQSSPYFWHKTNFIVVVFGIPIIAVLLIDRLVASSGRRSWPTPADRLRRCGPRRPDLRHRASTPDDLDVDEHDAASDLNPLDPARRRNDRRHPTGAGCRRRLTTLAAVTACGSGEVNPSPSVVPGASPGGSLTIGISFDQPGLGLKDGDTYTGFDVDTATYVAKALGVPRRTSPGRRPTRATARPC